MDSEIARRLKLRYPPIAILFTDRKPAGAAEFAEGKRGCAIALLTAVAKGRTAVFSRSTYGCLGGGVGLGFGNLFANCPGGFEYFLSSGRGEGFPPGEGYKKTPELATTFVEQLPITDIPYKYVIFAPLATVDEAKDEAKIIVFYANADQLSALVVLANYGRPGLDNVIIPFGSGCQSVVLNPWAEAQRERPRAVVGLTDITARPMVDADLLSFAVPLAMFREMEANVAGSFLDRHDWELVAGRLEK